MTNLRAYRTKQGLRQTDLAERVGITVRQIQNYEAGKQIPSVMIGYLLARALGTSIEDLFDLRDLTRKDNKKTTQRKDKKGENK